MTVDLNLHTANIPLKVAYLNNVNFKANSPSNLHNPTDTVEINKKKKSGLSTQSKIGIGIGILAAVAAGIILHKNLTNKITQESQQVTRELSQSIKELINKGELTTKEAELFDSIKSFEGDEFITKAYDKIVHHMNLPKAPELKIIHEPHNFNDGHYGKVISINPDALSNLEGNEKKVRLLNTIRHELEHYKQDLIMYKELGAEEFFMYPYVGSKLTKYGHGTHGTPGWDGLFTTRNLLKEECEKYNFDYSRLPKRIVNGEEQVEMPFENLRQMYEQEKPVEIFKTINWDEVTFSPEELAKARAYADAQHHYISLDYLPKELTRFRNLNDFNLSELPAEDMPYYDIFSQKVRQYQENLLEVDANRAGDTLADKFRVFLSALNL